MDTNSDAMKLALRVAERLGNLDIIGAGPGPDGSGEYPPATLSGGDLGVALALLHAGEALDDEVHLSAAHTLLRRAARSTAHRPLKHPGLWTGTAGFAWVLAEFTRREPRYLGTLHRVATDLSAQVLAEPLHVPSRKLYDYDMVSGSAGQLAALLAVADVADAADEDLRTALRKAAEHLVEHLMAVTSLDEDGLPLWFVPPHLYSHVEWRTASQPHGFYDLGFAHGLPGVLAALCRAEAEGYGGGAIPGRVAEITGWLARLALRDETGPSWPAAFPVRPGTREPMIESVAPGRAAWCYGPEGVTAALLPAAVTIGAPDVYADAVAALERAARTPSRERGCFSPTLCHGHAGLLTMYTRAHTQTGRPAFAAARDTQVAELEALADDEHAFIFADEPERGSIIQNRGLLEGAAGVMLALLGAAGAVQWDEILLLTPAGSGVMAGTARAGERAAP
ncbi:lanthionine synthetase C family protein [Sphaerisporangium flaviroseum]|uniref:Lanthionine synthetase C family protein n=1 Tax=Sphaerisporangium flaviroseum TaxID=509199 RepID=A0ABP7J9C6_9ACTN